MGADRPAPRILTVNAGSSSLKLALLDGDDRLVAARRVDRWDGRDMSALGEVLREAGATGDPDAAAGPVDAVGHRVVHGGSQFAGPVVVDAALEEAILDLSPLAPLHQPAAVAGIRAVRSLLPDAPHVACFDTGFHADLPAAAATYALPATWRERWPLRRYGFHGLSHRYAAGRAAQLVGRPLAELRVVSCHLGAGASLCAVAGGRSVDTTMGFTPLEGLVMATRSGSVDPGLVLWLLREGRVGPDDVYEGLEHRSGLAGLSGTSGDMRDVLAARRRGHEPAELAFDVYVHRLRASVAAMAAAIGGLDVLAFTGGVGEHAPEVRAAAAARLGFLGVGIDAAANDRTGGDGDITVDGAPTRTVVVTAREDLEMARLVRAAVA